MKFLKRLRERFSLGRRLSAVEARIASLTADRVRVTNTLRKRRKSLTELSKRLETDLNAMRDRMEAELEEAAGVERRYKTELEIARNEVEAIQAAMDVVMTRQRSINEYYEADTAMQQRRRLGAQIAVEE